MRNTALKTKNHKHIDNSGFTLVETLVAITILMIAVAGPLTVAEKSLSAAIYARDQLTGSYLAQDAMESIRNIVDTNEISGNSSWLYASGGVGSVNDLSQCASDKECTIDTINNSYSRIIPQCSGTHNSCSVLELTNDGYAGTGIQPTNFKRSFYLDPFNVDGTTCSGSDCNAVNVMITVTWPGDVVGGGGVTLEDTIYNVQPQ